MINSDISYIINIRFKDETSLSNVSVLGKVTHNSMKEPLQLILNSGTIIYYDKYPEGRTIFKIN